MWNSIINKFYNDNKELKDILICHSRAVADKALAIAATHPELNIDKQFVEEAAMLHDIGIVKTDAPGIHCMGTEPYIKHGILGAEMLRAEGLDRHARVCERHTGAGLTAKEIEERKLPLPVADYMPESIEEQLICYADKFFSKSHVEHEKTLEQAERSIAKHGDEGLERFRRWHVLFG